MSNPSKAAGTRLESKIRDTLNDYAGRPIARRVALNGAYDKGDLEIRIGDLVLTGESKYSKNYPSEGQLSEYKRQTLEETANADSDGGVLFVNVPGRSINRLECWLQRSTHYKLEMQRVGILYPYDVPEDILPKVEELMLDGEYSWRRLTLLDFMHEYLGYPAWGDTTRKRNHK